MAGVRAAEVKNCNKKCDSDFFKMPQPPPPEAATNSLSQPISLTVKVIHQRKTIMLSKFTSGIDLPLIRGLWRVLYE
jgi:hypothetical protein